MKNTAVDAGIYFDIGSRVLVGDRAMMPGVLRYLGTVHFVDGLWCGVELDEEEGLHDGTVQGVRYFDCPPNRGVLAPLTRVRPAGCSSLERSKNHGLLFDCPYENVRVASSMISKLPRPGSGGPRVSRTRSGAVDSEWLLEVRGLQALAKSSASPKRVTFDVEPEFSTAEDDGVDSDWLKFQWKKSKSENDSLLHVDLNADLTRNDESMKKTKEEEGGRGNGEGVEEGNAIFNFAGARVKGRKPVGRPKSLDAVESDLNELLLKIDREISNVKTPDTAEIANFSPDFSFHERNGGRKGKSTTRADDDDDDTEDNGDTDDNGVSDHCDDDYIDDVPSAERSGGRRDRSGSDEDIMLLTGSPTFRLAQTAMVQYAELLRASQAGLAAQKLRLQRGTPSGTDLEPGRSESGVKDDLDLDLDSSPVGGTRRVHLDSFDSANSSANDDPYEIFEGEDPLLYRKTDGRQSDFTLPEYPKETGFAISPPPHHEPPSLPLLAPLPSLPPLPPPPKSPSSSLPPLLPPPLHPAAAAINTASLSLNRSDSANENVCQFLDSLLKSGQELEKWLEVSVAEREREKKATTKENEKNKEKEKEKDKENKREKDKENKREKDKDTKKEKEKDNEAEKNAHERGLISEIETILEDLAKTPRPLSYASTVDSCDTGCQMEMDDDMARSFNVEESLIDLGQESDSLLLESWNETSEPGRVSRRRYESMERSVLDYLDSGLDRSSPGDFPEPLGNDEDLIDFDEENVRTRRFQVSGVRRREDESVPRQGTRSKNENTAGNYSNPPPPFLSSSSSYSSCSSASVAQISVSSDPEAWRDSDRTEVACLPCLGERSVTFADEATSESQEANASGFSSTPGSSFSSYGSVQRDRDRNQDLQSRAVLNETSTDGDGRPAPLDADETLLVDLIPDDPASSVHDASLATGLFDESKEQCDSLKEAESVRIPSPDGKYRSRNEAGAKVPAKEKGLDGTEDAESVTLTQTRDDKTSTEKSEICNTNHSGRRQQNSLLRESGSDSKSSDVRGFKYRAEHSKASKLGVPKASVRMSTISTRKVDGNAEKGTEYDRTKPSRRSAHTRIILSLRSENHRTTKADSKKTVPAASGANSTGNGTAARHRTGLDRANSTRPMSRRSNDSASNLKVKPTPGETKLTVTKRPDRVLTSSSFSALSQPNPEPSSRPPASSKTLRSQNPVHRKDEVNEGQKPSIQATARSSALRQKQTREEEDSGGAAKQKPRSGIVAPKSHGPASRESHKEQVDRPRSPVKKVSTPTKKDSTTARKDLTPIKAARSGGDGKRPATPAGASTETKAMKNAKNTMASGSGRKITSSESPSSEVLELKNQLNAAKILADQYRKEKIDHEKLVANQEKQYKERITKFEKALEDKLAWLKEDLEIKNKYCLIELSEKHKEEMVRLKEADEAKSNELTRDFERSRMTYEKKIKAVMMEGEKSIKELNEKHKRVLEEITQKHEASIKLLEDKISSFQKELEKSLAREKSFQDAAKNDRDLRQQALLEIDSLEVVVETKNTELKRLRLHNSTLEEKVRQIPVMSDKLISMQRKIEQLETILSSKMEIEKELLDTKQKLLKRSMEGNEALRKLSMNNEELVWRLSQSELGSPIAKDRKFSFSTTPSSPLSPMSRSAMAFSSTPIKK